jgi:hypothetical protein
MTSTLMVTDLEIAALLYLKDDRKIAHYLGISEERVARIRPKPVITPPQQPEKVMAQPPRERESVLTPGLCPTCEALVSDRLMVTHIQALVAAYYKIPVREMTSERRHREVSHPRQVAMYLAYELTPKSLPDIGKRFGDRDHTTVIHAIRQVKKRIIEDHEIYADVQALRERLAA